MRRKIRPLIALGLIAMAIALGYFVLERSARVARSEQAVAEHADEVFRAASSPVAGNPDGDVSVVAFFDYNCPYCRKDGPALEKLIARDGGVRLVLKELPVLGPDSDAAARAALAAKRQGKYLELYQRLIGARGRVTKARALAVADELGLDRARLEKDMDDPVITRTLLDNTRLASALGVRGVPYYLVGDREVSEEDGDLYEALADEAADIRENGCHAAC